MQGGLSDRMKGYYRDKRILEVIEKHRCLSAEQVQVLIFRGMPSGKRKCQQRLKKLTDRGRLKRWRYALEEPYAYYTDLTSKVEQMEHLVSLNWVLVWLELRRKSWEELHRWTYEPVYSMIRPDSFVEVRNTVTGAIKAFYVELDRGWRNRMDKVEKYNELYKSDEYALESWVESVKRFPAIIIATTNDKRLKRINEAIERDNQHGLEFIPVLVDDLRKEVTE